MGKDSPQFKITLQENGVHSFRRGIETYEKYVRTRQPLLLKDAIMFTHHGIELLMKQILVEHSEYLIFEDLATATTKQRDADKLGIGIFFLKKPPMTVSYAEAIRRVLAFVKPPELTEALVKDLDSLNSLRNQVEHYAIDADKDDVEKVLSAIREPLQRLFDLQIGEVEELKAPAMGRRWSRIQSSATIAMKAEQEVVDLVGKFNGQKVPGRLLNLETTTVLPKFDLIQRDYAIAGSGIRLDILAEGKGGRWGIEVKVANAPHSVKMRLREGLGMVGVYSRAAQATPWLVVLGTHGEIPIQTRSMARSEGILVSGSKEFTELKRMVESKATEDTDTKEG